MFSGKNPTGSQLTADESKAKGTGAVDAKAFIELFKKNAMFTSGCGAYYAGNVLNATDDSELVKSYPKKGVFNPVGTKLIAGQRLLPGLVTRAIDANKMRIQQEVKMNVSVTSLSAHRASLTHSASPPGCFPVSLAVKIDLGLHSTHN